MASSLGGPLSKRAWMLSGPLPQTVPPEYLKDEWLGFVLTVGFWGFKRTGWSWREWCQYRIMRWIRNRTLNHEPRKLKAQLVTRSKVKRPPDQRCVCCVGRLPTHPMWGWRWAVHTGWGCISAARSVLQTCPQDVWQPVMGWPETLLATHTYLHSMNSPGTWCRCWGMLGDPVLFRKKSMQYWPSDPFRNCVPQSVYSQPVY